MGSFKAKLLSGAVVTSFVSLAVGVGIGIVSDVPQAVAQNPCAAKNPCAPMGCNPCNPCAAENPCAAMGCNPCNPCAAENPCAAMGCNPCNPCAAENPCAAMGCNPCNPCAAENPCAAMGCNPCNPCAAKNPCAAMGCNPCNPCAAKNPCAPTGCNPCNPCAAGEMVELSVSEANASYGTLIGEMKAAYNQSGNAIAAAYGNWTKVNSSPYPSNGSHGSRYLNNYVNEVAASYASFEDAGEIPVGGVIAKDSFDVSPNGNAAVGPLFLMEKMAAGFNESSGDWRYTMIMPNGSTFGVTNGEGAANVEFCIACHVSAASQDHLFFLPQEYRAD